MRGFEKQEHELRHGAHGEAHHAILGLGKQACPRERNGGHASAMP